MVEIWRVTFVSLIFTRHLRREKPGYLSGIALSYGLDDLWFEYRQELGIFFFTTASRTVLISTQPPIQWEPGALSLGIKRPGCGDDQPTPSSAEVKNAWSYASTPSIRLHDVVPS
jgi:hypothetical protein